MNTPGYFCMDNFTTKATPVAVANVTKPWVAKVYPNPAADILYVEVKQQRDQKHQRIGYVWQVIDI